MDKKRFTREDIDRIASLVPSTRVVDAAGTIATVQLVGLGGNTIAEVLFLDDTHDENEQGQTSE